jgi:hypothetical protein
MATISLLESRAIAAELQMAVDLLTTNETYFFREPKHFALLRELAEQARAAPARLRVWSAASSSGEEPYSIAMVLADVLGDGAWEVLGTDISTRVLERARRPLSDGARQRHAADLLRASASRAGQEAGTMLIEKACASACSSASEPEPALAQAGQLRCDLPAQRDDLFQSGDQAPGGGAPAGAPAPGRLSADRPFGNAERYQRHAAGGGPVHLSQAMNTMPDTKVIDIFLMPGDVFVGDEQYRVRTLLGSCVSVTLWHPLCASAPCRTSSCPATAVAVPIASPVSTALMRWS